MATFRLTGDGPRTAAAVSRRLGVTPTDHGAAGAPARPRSGRTFTEAHWSLCSSATGTPETIELDDALARLLDQLQPHTSALWRLVDEGYWANWFCYVGSHATEHAVELPRPLLQRLLELPGDLWFDVYADDPGISAR